MCFLLYQFFVITIDLDDVSGHPWIVDDTVAPDKPLDSAVISRLKHFSAMNKLKKMALRVCVIGFVLYVLLFLSCLLLALKFQLL